MNKIKISADLSIVSNQHQISLNSNDGDLVINIIGESVLFISFKQLLSVYRLRNKLKYLDQSVFIKNNSKDLLTFKNGNLSIKSYSAILKIIIKSIFG